jgi:hypothetical protein
MCTQYLHHIHPPVPLSPHPPCLPLVSTSPDRTCSALLFSNFVKIKIVIQGVSLWHFNVCMYYTLNWYISSIFLFSTLFLSYVDFSRFLKIPYSFLNGEYTDLFIVSIPLLSQNVVIGIV